MRILVPALLLLVCGLPSAVTAAEGEDKPTTFVNHQVSARRIGVNQPVRLEFTTMPRQVDGVDVAAAVTNGVALAAGNSWRLLGKPVVKESEKTRTISVSLTLLPRVTGDLELPRLPLSWLTGEPRPQFGLVTVAQHIAIGGETRPLPGEFDGVGGFLWGDRLDDVKTKTGAQATVQGERTLVKVSSGLTLIFRQGELCEAAVVATGLTLDDARASFLERWGLPLAEDTDGLSWILGWTRITAAAGPEGTLVAITREDLAARQAAAQVKGRVFQLLDGPTK
jgi:hypothetical protein